MEWRVRAGHRRAGAGLHEFLSLEQHERTDGGRSATTAAAAGNEDDEAAVRVFIAAVGDPDEEFRGAVDGGSAGDFAGVRVE